MVELVAVLLAFVLVALGVTVVRAPESHTWGDSDPPRDVVRGRSLHAPGVGHALPWIAGLTVGFWLALMAGFYTGIAAAAGVATAVVLRIAVGAWVAARLSRFEMQLADSLDLMVSALRAGGSLVDALASAARDAPRPLRAYLRELIDRVRIGEPPVAVLAHIEERVSLESFRLFSLTLAAHWEGGGSLATTLSNVGRTIRDRVDVARRIRSQAIETQVSVLGVLIVTYGLALLMWKNYPDRFETFATSELGGMFIGLSIFLQAIGLLWISAITRIEV